MLRCAYAWNNHFIAYGLRYSRRGIVRVAISGFAPTDLYLCYRSADHVWIAYILDSNYVHMSKREC